MSNLFLRTLAHIVILPVLFSICSCTTIKGTDITVNDIQNIDVGVTTKREVIQIFGEPTSETVSANEELWIYVFSNVKHNLFLKSLKSKNKGLSLKFENDVVTSCFFSSRDLTTKPFLGGGNIRKSSAPCDIYIKKYIKNSELSQASPSENKLYEPLDLIKWKSGLYNEEFVGRSVIVDGKFMSTPQIYKYPGVGDSAIRFIVIPKGNGGGSYMNIGIQVRAPLSMRETLYPIENNQRVRVYGVFEKQPQNIINLPPVVLADKLEVLP